MWHDVVPGDDRLADAPDNIGDVDAVAVRALDLLDDDEPFRAVAVMRREGRAAVAAQRRVRLLDGVLDILRVVIGAADDDDVLEAASDVQLAGIVEEAEIAGPQPMLKLIAGNFRSERDGACLRLAPVAARDIRTGNPDFADPPGSEPTRVSGSTIAIRSAPIARPQPTIVCASAALSGGATRPARSASRLTVRVTGPAPRWPADTRTVASAKPYAGNIAEAAKPCAA